MSERFFNVRPISRPSGDYERNRAEKIKGSRFPQISNIFGMEEIVFAINPTSNGAVSIADMLNRADVLEIPGIKEALLKIRKEFSAKAGDHIYLDAISNFFQESLSHKIIGPYLAEIFLNSPGGTVSIREIPDHMLLNMVIVHFNLYQQKYDAFKKRERALRTKVLKRFQQLINEGIFEADFSNIVNKINKMSVHLRDTLKQSISTELGLADLLKDIVNISSSIDIEREEEVYNHEMVHVTSGVVPILISEDGSIQVEEGGLRRDTGKVALFRTGLTYEPDGGVRLNWLSEAVTQDLTLLLLSKTKGHAYVKEMELLGELLKRGQKPLDKKLFYNAYFEDGSEGEREASQKIKLLVSAIDEAYGVTHFLERLDNYVAKYGVGKAIEALKTDPNTRINLITYGASPS